VKLESLWDSRVMEPRGGYSAEEQILKAPPKTAKAAGSQGPGRSFREDLTRTERQVEPLERIFAMPDDAPEGQKYKGMEGPIDEAEESTEETEEQPPAVHDAGVISAAQRVERCQMAGYGRVRAYARRPGLEDHAHQPAETRAEEEQTDRKTDGNRGIVQRRGSEVRPAARRNEPNV
jgi:ferritin-like metal-binding protein YciE